MKPIENVLPFTKLNASVPENSIFQRTGLMAQPLVHFGPCFPEKTVRTVISRRDRATGYTTSLFASPHKGCPVNIMNPSERGGRGWQESPRPSNRTSPKNLRQFPLKSQNGGGGGVNAGYQTLEQLWWRTEAPQRIGGYLAPFKQRSTLNQPALRGYISSSVLLLIPVCPVPKLTNRLHTRFLLPPWSFVFLPPPVEGLRAPQAWASHALHRALGRARTA